MNLYSENKKWFDSVIERLQLGIKVYGGESDFMSDYACRCITMDRDDMEDLFEKWGLETRSKKLQRIIKKIKYDKTE